MQDQQQTTVKDHLEGDKIRIRVGVEKGQRGNVTKAEENHLEILLEDGRVVRTSPQDATNYSLAARKAWKTMKSK